uniref:Uncharacterized protein n=1 Tax=Parascaris univalens TaxID=6257 RepID=A0A915B3V6_PARUN
MRLLNSRTVTSALLNMCTPYTVSSLSTRLNYNSVKLTSITPRFFQLIANDTTTLPNYSHPIHSSTIRKT